MVTAGSLRAGGLFIFAKEMINIAIKLLTSVTYTATGEQTTFAIPFDYLRPAFIYVDVDEHNITEGFEVVNRTVKFSTPPAKDAVVRIYRNTTTKRLVSWADASILKAKDMTVAEAQQLHLIEEEKDWSRENTVHIDKEGVSSNQKFDPSFRVKPDAFIKTNSKGTGLELYDKVDMDADIYREAGKYINDHPEYVTTVKDNTLTESKFMDEAVSERVLQDEAVSESKLASTLAKKKASWYESVAEMKVDRLLKAGMTACTLGYYSPNDGGAGTYIIRAKQEADVDDGGSVHELVSGLVAELVVENGTVCPEQFGAKGDGVTDDSLVLEKILNFNNVRFVNSYLISKTMVIDGTNNPSVPQTKNITFEKNLIYTGNDCAILVKGKYVHLEIKGVLKSSGAGIRLLGEGFQCANCNITFHNIISDGNGIELISNIDGCFNHVITGQGIYYGDRHHNIATSEVFGIYCQTKTDSSFVTESRFDIKYIGNFNKAIFMNGAIGGQIQNIFLNFISLEHNTYGIYADSSSYVANHVRIGEYGDDGRAITCIGVCKADIYLNTHFSLSAINIKQLTGGKVKLHVQGFSFANKGVQSIANLMQSVLLNGKPPCLTPQINANYRLNVNENYVIGKDVDGYLKIDIIPQTFSVAKKTAKVILPYEIYNYCGTSELFIEFDEADYSIEFLDEELNSLASITSTHAGEVKKMIFTLNKNTNVQKVIVY